ncbi:MAG TPA: hypothetical protein VFL13_12590, partial [Candidatus Baltobacteraceae bacterium]|nr:hypothetical protein [Candidatus Baltobacteraceae bacterium]
MRTIILLSLLTALVTGCAGGGASTVTPPSNNPHTYTVTDIGAQAFPAALNDSGVVVGQMNGQAFAYSGGAVHMLGMLPGGATSAAAAINDAGTIVGTTYFAGSSRFEATLFSLTGPPQPLGTGDGSDSTAVGVNAAGEIVGTVLSAPGCLGRVAIFDGHGNATEFADNALAIAVNNSGTILYETATPSAVVSCGTSPAAYLYPANTAVPYPANIDTGNGIPNVAALDNLGDVAGNYNDTSGNGALFLYHNGSSNELSMPGFANLSA